MNDDNPLKAFRESQVPPISQKALGELLGVAPNTVWRWESGNRKIAPKRLPVIQARTGIDPQKLRPDVFGEVA